MKVRDTSKDLSVQMANVVFGPTLLAYFWIMVKYLFSGLILYGAFLIVGYKMGLFEEFGEWPRSSKAGLYGGPVLIAIGIYCSTQRTSYWMIGPGLLYMLLIIVGALALRGKVIN